MARMIPPTPIPGSPDSEIATFEALAGLDESWAVLQSVRWQAVRGKRQGDGEADFVLVHPRYGLIVLEVKGGGIRVEHGVWYTTNRFGVTEPIKSPFEQGVASKHALVRYLRESLPGGEKVPVAHAVVLPNVEVDAPLGLDAPLVLTIDSRRLRDIRRAIAGVVAHWGQEGNLAPNVIDALVARLRPTVEIRRVLRDDVRAVAEELIKLTAQQIRVMGGMRRNRRAKIVGGAGTGKTILAIEKAREFGAQGSRTLLTCFNEPLAAMSARALEGQPNVVVRHFHSLCVATMRAAGRQPPSTITDEWWTTKAADALVEALEKDGHRFDAIVVDEGQDFAGDWITALVLTLASPDESPFYVFLDSHQDIYVRGCSYPSDWPTYELTTNCRNTLPIAVRVASVFGDTVDSLGAKGPEPALEFVSSDKELVARVESLVERLLEREKLTASQVAVLSSSKALVDRLRTMTVGDHVFCAPGRRGIATETIWRFKGLESAVVVLALPAMSEPSLESARGLAYVGLSRPQAALFVVAAMDWKGVLGGSRSAP
jgi:superfamily I DNA/RNA helicase